MPRTTTRGAALALLLLGSEVSAFSLRLPPQQRSTPRAKTLLQAHSGRRAAFAAAATALTTSLTANAAPADQRWAASEFFDEVRNGAVDRVTFAAEGGALVAVDADGGRHDVSILQSQVSEAVQALRAKRVPFAVQAAQQQDGGLLGVVANLIVPVALLGGLLFLLRGGPGGQGGGPFGGGDGPMGMLQSRAKVEVEPETGADAAWARHLIFITPSPQPRRRHVRGRRRLRPVQARARGSC